MSTVNDVERSNKVRVSAEQEVTFGNATMTDEAFLGGHCQVFYGG